MAYDRVTMTLMEMERIREMSYEAENTKEERKLTKEYNRLWESIKDEVESRE